MAKKRLERDVKEFIVRSLAEYEKLPDVVTAVKEKFGVIIRPQTAQLYKPDTVAGKDLSAPLKTLFYETRRKYNEKLEAEFREWRKNRSS
ncbi:MAG TPA: DUF2280 domain-containing protein [Pyrinomonadaceae bacterium]|jgi:hypothetical protein